MAKIIHITGPAGAGKSLLLIALYLYFFRRDRAGARDAAAPAGGAPADRFELLEASQGLLRQVEGFLQGRELRRTPVTDNEFLRVRWYSPENGWRGQELLFVSYPGEQLRGTGAAGAAPAPKEKASPAVVNPVELRRNLESGDAILAATVNGFCWQEIGEPGLLGLTAWWQEKCGFPLAQAVALSAELLWGLSPEGIVNLDAGYDELSEEVLASAVVTYHAEETSREGQFTVEGVAAQDGARVLRVLRSVVAKVARVTEVDLITLTEVAAKVSRKVAVVTHASLLPFVRCLHREDFDALFTALLGPDEDRLVSQDVLAPLLRMTLRNNTRRPIRKEDVLTGGAERFWVGVRRQLLRPARPEATALGRAFPAGSASSVSLLRRVAGAAVGGCALLGLLAVVMFYALFGPGVATALTALTVLVAALVAAFFVFRVQDQASVVVAPPPAPAPTPAPAPVAEPVMPTASAPAAATEGDEEDAQPVEARLHQRDAVARLAPSPST